MARTRAYEEYHNNVPIIYKDSKKQGWFEGLEHVSKFKIPNNLLPASRLKSFGIKVEDNQAVAWAYNAHSHKVYLLYDINSFKPSSKATKIQIEKYNDYMTYGLDYTQ